MNKNNLYIDISKYEIDKELLYFYNTPGSISAQPNKNKIVLYFQQDNFYKNERILFQDNEDIRRKIIDNRIKYLNKSENELTELDILRGFKISGLYPSYSHFSPLWTKYFVEKYNLKYVADPFGGWGHHMIGFAAANCKYIYNDLSHNTVEGVRKINEFLGTHYQIIEGDAREFIIPYSCDGVFMCPPYYNLERYECGDFKSIEEYNQLMLDVFDNCKASKARIIGIIIREDFEYLLKQGFEDWISKEEVNTMKSHFSKAGKKKEFLYCFEKLRES